MNDIYPWKRDYPIPTQLSGSSARTGMGLAGWRTERLDNPSDVFIDIYRLLERLMDCGNLQMRGRRGTGKTMYFLKGQQQLGKNYFNDRSSSRISAYVDLKAIHNYHEVPSLVLRAESVFREVIRSVLSGGQWEGARRYCVQDYIESQGVARRWVANRAAKDLLDFLSGEDEEGVVSEVDFERICLAEQQIIHRKGGLTPASAFDSSQTLIRGLRDIDDQYFADTHLIVNQKLIRILNALKIESLVIFVDEFSSPAVYQGIQAPLLDRLLRACDGQRVSVKVAAVPGTTIVYDSQASAASPKQSTLGIFDFEDQSLKNSQVIQTGNFEVFLRNLANAELFYRIYLDAEPAEQGFTNFISDTFEKPSDFYEFLKAGEGLPRQMLEVFFESNNIRKSMNPKGKLTGLHIQLASRQSLQITYRSQILGDKKCAAIMTRIYQVNSRVIKIERMPEFVDAVARLAHWGFIHACPIAPTDEPELSAYPLEYFITSYRTEVSNQFSHTKSKQQIQLDNLSNIAKDKLAQLYPKARPVLLADLTEVG